VYSISNLYRDNKWDTSAIEKLGISSLEEGIILKVKDLNGNIIWDATIHNNGLCTQMINHMAQNMATKYPNLNGGYVENKYNISNNSVNVGVLEIGYYGPFYFDDHDLIFINGINNVIFGVGIFTLLISLIIGSVFSKRISKPILKVIDKAKHISEGYFSGRIEDKSNTREISELISSVNDLASSLEKQDVLRKRLTSDVAHELRTPLSTLRGNLEAMRDGVWQPSKERFESCNEEVIRITKLVSDLEKLTKYESENLILNKTEFNLSEVIKNTVVNLENEYKTKEITVNYVESNINISADKDKITQVIINILTNAIKYNKIGGHIDITVNKDNNSTVITFKDDGIGISEEDLPYIFERFYRADKSRSRATGGSGIGLAICKSIVEAHGGEITASSKFGEGTTIVVKI
jgi:signal transduction histidine kinase